MLILIADDFGLSDEVSRGILKLSVNKLLSGYSVMVNMPFAHKYTQQVIESRRCSLVGLHLNLTEGRPLSKSYSRGSNATFSTLPKVISASIFRTADRVAMRAEITAQFDRFEANYGCQPDHVDGHQHVHMLPIVRKIIMEELQARYPENPPLVRQSVSTRAILMQDGWVNGLKSITVAVLGFGFKSTLKAAGIPMNSSFAGYSTFANHIPYKKELSRWLTPSEQIKLVMCHPGFEAQDKQSDVLSHRRHEEMSAIESIPELKMCLWRPKRSDPGSPIDWLAVV